MSGNLWWSEVELLLLEQGEGKEKPRLLFLVFCEHGSSWMGLVVDWFMYFLLWRSFALRNIRHKPVSCRITF